MERSFELELLDTESFPQAVVARAYRDLTRLHRFLGHTPALIRAIRRDPLPVRRVLDIGCAHGGVLAEIRDRLGVEVIGADLRPPADALVPVVAADAVRDALPSADVAISVCLAHHLSEVEVGELIRNTGRSCRRLILVDLVRHRLPLTLFRIFVAPFFSPLAVSDGMLSVRRAFTPAELAAIAKRAGVRYRHSVAPFYISQTLDITY
jgi:2-polyprenyl-3-methyl-5-hydroxy-6-metoxy-1,4-benzoquinol methylase